MIFEQKLHVAEFCLSARNLQRSRQQDPEYIQEKILLWVKGVKIPEIKLLQCVTRVCEINFFKWSGDFHLRESGAFWEPCDEPRNKHFGRLAFLSHSWLSWTGIDTYYQLCVALLSSASQPHPHCFPANCSVYSLSKEEENNRNVYFLVGRHGSWKFYFDLITWDFMKHVFFPFFKMRKHWRQWSRYTQ